MLLLPTLALPLVPPLALLLPEPLAPLPMPPRTPLVPPPTPPRLALMQPRKPLTRPPKLPRLLPSLLSNHPAGSGFGPNPPGKRNAALGRHFFLGCVTFT